MGDHIGLDCFIHNIKHVNPPTYIPKCRKSNLKSLLRSIKASGNKKWTPRPEALQLISEIFKEQLTKLQNPVNCNELNFICGHNNICGLGCQVHQRISCLMVSYALGIPLIHEEKGWGYNETWSDVFVPIGSKCSPGNETYRFVWTGVLYREINGTMIKSDMIANPIRSGIPVLRDLAEVVERSHPNPALWWIGQFVKFGFRLNEQHQKYLENALAELQFKHPIIGVHIRRSDKNSVESKRTRHEIPDYMKRVEKHYKKLVGTSSKNISSIMKNVFIASDDSTLLAETRKQYPSSKNWNLIGFEGRQTHATDVSRQGALNEIVLDLFLLYQCDFVVCGYSSNVCGLLLEMFSSKFNDGIVLVDGSLDGHYYYNRYMPRKMSTKILKVCSTDSNILMDSF